MDSWTNLEWYYNFDVNSGRLISTDAFPIYHILPWTAVALYYLMLVVFPRLFNKGFKVEIFITIWNLGVWLLSVAMFTGGFYGAYLIVKAHGFYYFICDVGAVEKPGILVYWTYAFALSKYLELFDTFWVLLKVCFLSFDISRYVLLCFVNLLIPYIANFLFIGSSKAH